MPGLPAKNIIDLAARIVFQKINEEGISGKVLTAKCYTRVAYIHEAFYSHGHNQPIITENTILLRDNNPITVWRPTCVDEATWEAMLHILGHSNILLTEWIERAIRRGIITVTDNGLLPLSDIIAKIRQLHLEGHAFRRTETDLYYFDDNLTCQCRSLTEEETRHLSKYHAFMDSYNIICAITHLRNTWFSAALQFKPGMTLEQWLPIMLNTEKLSQQEISDAMADEAIYTKFERVIQNIKRPVFGRTPENTKANTFDWIRVEVTIARYVYPTRKDLIQQLKTYRPLIDRMVLEKIQETKKFQNMDIPINCLKLTECTLTRDFMLEYMFELKPLLTSERKEP